MQTFPVPVTPRASQIRPRTALVASADSSFRQRVSQSLRGLRWHVREAESGAEAWMQADDEAMDALIVDSWLPDLNLQEFVQDFQTHFPEVDVVTLDGGLGDAPRGPHRQEILYALHRSQEPDTPAWNDVRELEEEALPARFDSLLTFRKPAANTVPLPLIRELAVNACDASDGSFAAGAVVDRLPELVGDAHCMLEVSRRIRLVAPRSTPVLIEGPTGSGKELVAAAVHRLSDRRRKPFVAINCAAIPETLLEAELFGHTRGAFTGAVQGRIGRIEAANGGTLFLDEIGEMPVTLQAKLLRFVESGELQRVGDNETLKVDVRILAATHRPLASSAHDGVFRADLYYRLAVFLIRTPALAEHPEDIPALVEHFLEKMARRWPAKRILAGAMARLKAHSWPGNVRELQHVLERAAILAGDAPTIRAEEIEFGMCLG